MLKISQIQQQAFIFLVLQAACWLSLAPEFGQSSGFPYVSTFSLDQGLRQHVPFMVTGGRARGQIHKHTKGLCSHRVNYHSTGPEQVTWSSPTSVGRQVYFTVSTCQGVRGRSEEFRTIIFIQPTTVCLFGIESVRMVWLQATESIFISLNKGRIYWNYVLVHRSKL